MADVNVFANGARWFRADFHLHTRRDGEFKDSGDGSSYIAHYIAALAKAEIQVGAITNHNKFDCEEFKTLREAAKKEGIYLLPGVELTVNDGSNGIHALVVFREDWIDNRENHDHVNSFLGLTFAGQTNTESSNARSNHNLIDTIRELDKFEKEYLLIFAHVEDDTGLWGALEGGRIIQLGKNDRFRERTVAFQKVRTRDRRRQMKGWLGDWYPVEVEGSDPKSIDEIGKGRRCRIKLGAFTFEAVRFALMPATERLVTDDAPDRTPHCLIMYANTGRSCARSRPNWYGGGKPSGMSSPPPNGHSARSFSSKVR